MLDLNLIFFFLNLTNQLLSCIRVKFVCSAICFFSSSVGYGCFRNKSKLSKINRLVIKDIKTYNNMLKKPFFHNSSSIFWQYATFSFDVSFKITIIVNVIKRF